MKRLKKFLLNPKKWNKGMKTRNNKQSVQMQDTYASGRLKSDNISDIITCKCYKYSK